MEDLADDIAASIERLADGGTPAEGRGPAWRIQGFLRRALHAARTHLGMEVAFISQFQDGRRIFRVVDCSLAHDVVREGDGDPLEASYCQRVVDGRLPELIRNPATLPAALELPVTRQLPVGAHLSVPIRLSDGTIYGTFCCFSLKPDYTLSERDLGMMRFFSDLAADYIEKDVKARKRKEEIRVRVQSVLDRAALSAVYQPICHLRTGAVHGYESLARFDGPPVQGPDRWFADAMEVGLGAELETLALRQGSAGLGAIPDSLYLSVNMSPASVAERLALASLPLHRLVLEITEHEVISHYGELLKDLAPLRARGLRVAVDDAGAGYASFSHILNLKPDFIKLDRSLVRDIGEDLAKQALGTALAAFGKATGARIVAEGIETEAERQALIVIGIEFGQGYLLGKPRPLEGPRGFEPAETDRPSAKAEPRNW